ncbi:TIGR03013 family XrtA/PEP-CTERM system glycosyltransferase [Lentisalinibacter sediminis]|uniref:TIGR03013 family XrtA/PEP-CTERM system glycosyltransferase n=1 Tax=Lentisalinibacter sediminis TaxID=2992237 RepID=UPI0038657695
MHHNLLIALTYNVIPLDGLMGSTIPSAFAHARPTGDSVHIGLMPFRLFNNYLRLPVVLLAAAECAVVYASLYLAAAWRFDWNLEAYSLIHGPVWPQAAATTAIVCLCLIALGLYQFHQRLYFKESLARLVVAFMLAGFPLAVVWFSFPLVAPTRGVAILAALISFAGLSGIRYFFLRTADENVFRRRTLVYGAGERAKAIQEIRRKADRRGFKVVGHVGARGDRGIAIKAKHYLEHDRQLLAIASEREADEIVVAMDDRRGNLPIDELLACKVRGIDCMDLVGFLEREMGKIRIDLVNPSWMIFSSGFRITPLRRATKRALDLLIGVTASVAALPLMALSALAIKIEDGLRAPVLYRQKRVGLHGGAFDVLKFRSMNEDAESDGEARWAEKDDPRITRVGGVLRKLRFDELPQLFNVLKGEMSIVGPRPERPEFVSQLKQNIPFYAERHTVKPGITGWAQLKYQYGSSEQDAIEKLQYDLYYVKNHSLLLDLVIMLQTAEVILWGKGAR